MLERYVDALLARDFETQLDKRPGFSLLSLDTLFVKLQLTEAEPGAFTFLHDSSAAYLIASEEAGDIFDPATAKRLHDDIYSSGGSRDPEEAYVAFRGREPDVEPLLQRRGLK